MGKVCPGLQNYLFVILGFQTITNRIEQLNVVT